MTYRPSSITETAPAPVRRPGPNSVCSFISSAPRSGNHPTTHAHAKIIRRVCDRIRHLAPHQPYPGCSRRLDRQSTFPIA